MADVLPVASSVVARPWKRRLALVLALAGTYGCTGGLSCGGAGGGCDSAYEYPQTAAQVPNGTETVDEGVRMRMTQQALDIIALNIRPILGELLGNDPNNPDYIQLTINDAVDLGGGFSLGEGPGEQHPTYVTINAQALADSMVLEFVGDDAGEPTGIRLVAGNVPIGVDARVFWFGTFEDPIGLFEVTATAACDLYGTNNNIGGFPMVTSMSIEILLSPRVGSGAECDNNAPECLKIDVQVEDASINGISASAIEIDSPPLIGCNDGPGPCSEECSDGAIYPEGECDIGCGLADVLTDIVATLAGFFEGVINSFLPGILETQLRNALDDFDGTPISVSGRLDLASLVPGVLPESALDLGYAVGPTAGAFAVNDPANTPGAQGMDLIFRSGFEAAPPLPPEDTSVPHPCVRPIAGNDFANLYGGFRFEAPAVEPLTGVFEGQVYSLGLSMAQASVNQALFGMYNTGSLCLEVGTDAVHALAGGAFNLSAGLIDVLTEGKLRQYTTPEAPAVVALAPSQPPVVQLGAGDEEEGHLILDWPGVEISFYVMINERFSRVFAITADISMQLSVFSDPATETLRIAVIDGPTVAVCADCEGNYNELIPGVNFAEVLETLVGTLFDAALGDGLEFDYNITSALADALGVPLYIDFRGIETIPANDREFLNVYLALTNAPVNPVQARTWRVDVARDAGLLRERVSTEGERSHLVVEPTGSVRLDVDADDINTEYFAKIDFGAWRGPLTPEQDGSLVIIDPKLRVVAEHTITLRARHVGVPSSLEDEGTVVKVWVDPVEPTATLVRRADMLVADGSDVGTASDDLLVQWQLDDGDWQQPGSERVRALEDVRANRVAVRTIDRAGNFSAPASLDLKVERLRRDQEAGPADNTAGCGQTGAPASMALLGIALAGLSARRRRQQR